MKNSQQRVLDSNGCVSLGQRRQRKSLKYRGIAWISGACSFQSKGFAKFSEPCKD
jgi:hypothetical protein